MKERWWKYKISETERPWWKTLVVLFVVFAIAGAIKIVYRELPHKQKIPLESANAQWHSVGPITLVFEGQSYTGDVYFDRMSLEKKEGKITLWVKTTTHTPVIQHKGNETFRWDEQIVRWVVNCEAKEVKLDYISLFLKGKEQYSGKIGELNLPLVKGTTTYSVYEMVCFRDERK